MKEVKDVPQIEYLPMLLLRTLSSKEGSHDQNVQGLIKDSIQVLTVVKGLTNLFKRNMYAPGPQSVRFEFYFKTTLKEVESDIRFPTMDLKQMLRVTEADRFIVNLQDRIEKVTTPLMKVLDMFHQYEAQNAVHQRLADQNKPLSLPATFLEYPSDWKTMIIYCAEMTVKCLSNREFNGRINRYILETLKDKLNEPLETVSTVVHHWSRFLTKLILCS